MNEYVQWFKCRQSSFWLFAKNTILNVVSNFFNLIQKLRILVHYEGKNSGFTSQKGFYFKGRVFLTSHSNFLTIKVKRTFF